MKTDNITDKIYKKIQEQSRGKIFSIDDFYHFGNYNTIKSVLLRLNNEDKIIRVMDGLYTIPRYSKLIGEYSYPSVDEVANKIAEKFSWTISPAEDYALNLTGLSTQVPNEYTYVSDGPYRTYDYRGKQITFKHTSNRFIKEHSTSFAILIQAIKTLGRKNITNNDVKKMAKYYKKYISTNRESHENKLPIWIIEVLKNIKESKEHT